MTLDKPRSRDTIERLLEQVSQQEASARRSRDRELRVALRMQRKQLREELQQLRQRELASTLIDGLPPQEPTPPGGNERTASVKTPRKPLGLGLLEGMFSKAPAAESPPPPLDASPEMSEAPQPGPVHPAEIELPAGLEPPSPQTESGRVEIEPLEAPDEPRASEPSTEGPAWILYYHRLPRDTAKALQGYFLESNDSSRFETLLHHLLMTQLNHLYATAVGVGLGDQADPFLEQLHNQESSTDRKYHFPVEQVDGLSQLLRDADLGELVRPREAPSEAARILLVRASLFRTFVLDQTKSEAIPGKIEQLWRNSEGDIAAFVRKATDRGRLVGIQLNKGDFHHRQLPVRLRELRNALTHARGPDWLRGHPLPVEAFRKACNPWIGPALLEWIEREGWLMDLAVGKHLMGVDDGWLFELDRPGAPPFFVPRIDDNFDLEEHCLIDLTRRRSLFIYTQI
jgi:hypothetical protein